MTIQPNLICHGHGQGILLENVRGVCTDNRLVWSGTGTEKSDRPRIVVTAASREIDLRRNLGKVDLYKLAANDMAACSV